MLRSILRFTILISVVVSTKEYSDDIVSGIVDGREQQQQQQTDILCLCTEGEESWSKKIDEPGIQVTAG